MTRIEAEELISELLKSYEDITTQFDVMAKFTGCDCESQLWHPIWKMNDLLIQTVAELIGDESETLNWFIWDNECGKRKLKHSLPNSKRMRIVKDVKSLLDVLGY